MRKYARFLPLFLLLFSFACQQAVSESTESQAVAVETGLPFTEPGTAADDPFDSLPPFTQSQQDSIGERYDSLLSAIELRRQQLATEWAATPDKTTRTQLLADAGAYLTTQLTQHLLPCWYGTPWDFNGHVNRPHTGEIACGYFVSTPLRHMGIQLNRYRVAQQAAAIIVDKLCDRQQRFRDIDALLAALHAQADDLYIVGLDNHVGFLHKKGEEIAFIHSSFVAPSCALSEPAADSWVLQSSGLYVVGHLGSNAELLEAWLTGKSVIVP